MEKIKNRKKTRLQSFDYSSTGAYFITVCTQNKRCILSQIVGTDVLGGPEIKLTKYGKIADKYINQLNDFYEHITVENYVIMPNHIHFLLLINGPCSSTESTKTPVTGPSGTPVTGPSGTPVTGPSGTPVTGPSGTPVPTISMKQNSVISKFVSTFKRFCNKECGGNIWQYRSYDHVIRNAEDYDKHVKYIYENPIRWYYDELYIE